MRAQVYQRTVHGESESTYVVEMGEYHSRPQAEAVADAVNKIIREYELETMRSRGEI